MRASTQPIGDYGPALRIKRGDVAVVDAPDPGAPNRTIRRAMHTPPYVALQRKGRLSSEEREACDRYAITCEAELGAKSQDGIAIASPPWARGHPAMSQVQASASLRNAHQAVGISGTILLRLFVRDCLPVAEIARRRAEREEITLGRIASAIRRLAEHWGMVDNEC